MTEEQLIEQVLTLNGTALVAFKAPWCGPCKTLTPVLEEIKTDGYNVIIVDTDENQDLTMKYGIRSVPTTLILKNGLVSETICGVKPKSFFVDLLKD